MAIMSSLRPRARVSLEISPGAAPARCGSRWYSQAALLSCLIRSYPRCGFLHSFRCNWMYICRVIMTVSTSFWDRIQHESGCGAAETYSIVHCLRPVGVRRSDPQCPGCELTYRLKISFLAAPSNAWDALINLNLY